ncbi:MULTISPECIES: c-type cytochrome [unclassified Nitrosospira]|jgi:cytochrome c|uniref:c-type cytochrome n=1 Tax=unclassified Nitrosospira TaxID=2609267 RepID=UPI00088EA56F|nr:MULTISPECIES: c-type cytochrome [unclassified Nitrosospira]BCT66718.1 Cytochrome c-552 [Nitrosospira sp. NRS527]SCX39105.1 cytochrome c [Nitrosospira sp. Nsp1]
MKAVWIGMVAASALLMVGTAQANADLAKSSGCLNCHTVDKKLVGPALKDIAAKYKADPAAADKLAVKIQKGSQGVWGPIPMPPNSKVNDADAKTLAQFILSLK